MLAEISARVSDINTNITTWKRAPATISRRVST
jgi:hypothetical protein